MAKKLNQEERTLEYLKKHKYITAFDGFNKLAITQMHTVIHRLRENGVKIKTTMVKNKNTGTYFSRGSLEDGK